MMKLTKIKVYQWLRDIIIIFASILGLIFGFTVKENVNPLIVTCLLIIINAHTFFTSRIEDLYDEKITDLLNKLEEKDV